MGDRFAPIAASFHEAVSATYDADGRDLAASVRSTIEINSTLAEERGELLLELLGRCAGVSTLEGLRVADYGCGFGSLAAYFAAHGAAVTAVDMNARRLEVGRAVCRRHGLAVEFLHASIEDRPLGPASVDLAILNNSLCYLVERDRRKAALAAVADALEPGGWVVVRNPNRTCPLDQFTGLPLIHLLPPRQAKRVAGMLGRPRSNVRLATQRGARRELRAAGLDPVISCHPPSKGWRRTARPLTRYQHTLARRPPSASPPRAGSRGAESRRIESRGSVTMNNVVGAMKREPGAMTQRPHDDLARLRQELALERRRIRAMQTELSTLRTALASVKADVNRIGESQAWRWGHRAALASARLRGRRPRTTGAVDAALERIARLEEALDAPLSAPAMAAPGLPPGFAERVPQEADPAELGAEVRRRLGPPPALEDTPLVSIVVVTHNGLAFMQRLVDGLRHRTDYPAFELVVVDNASTDGTLEWLREADLGFPVVLEASQDNQPFGAASNRGAAAAHGDLLLFANNDVEPIEPGWLHELVAALGEGNAAAGARLLHAGVTHPGAPSGWIVQHRGIRFEADALGLQGRNAGDGDDAFDETFGTEAAYPAATAACLLVRRAALASVGGFPQDYRWGTEDVELGLRLAAEGHRLVCTGRAVLLHRESSSQQAAGREFMRLNRLGNRALFAQRWAAPLRREVRLDRLGGARHWSESPPSVAITLTSAEQRDGWGDWYTAHELGDALGDAGWQVLYVERKDERWYELPDGLDYLLALLDTFDPRRVDPATVTIAWIRNWTERWLERPWLDRFDLLLCSSLASVKAVRKATGRKATLFPLATNPERFSAAGRDGAAAELDYSFVGNRWNEERAIEQALRPRPGERAAIYGKGWDEVDHLRAHARGPAPYDSLPALYRSSKVVIDDAARHTLPYGSVNSRVFDALATGTPVVTNGAAGVRELFDEEFPVWDSAQSLREQLDDLLADPGRRAAIAERYRAQVLRRHTYAHRAQQLTRLLTDLERQLSFCIKIGAPSWEIAPQWGDLHFATALARELQRRGHRSLIQVLPEWEDLAGHQYDVAIVLRGLSAHAPKPGQFNVLWNISHPDHLTGDECDGYDLVCVASAPFAARLAPQTSTPVVVVEQATDPRVFRREPSERYAHDLVFVGNSRNVRRKVLDDLLPCEHDVAVYGSRWESLIDARHLAGTHVPNEELRQVYSSAKIVLNDHWDDMRANGFLSNRLYDAVACGALVISDRIEGLEERFAGAVVTYETRAELHELVERFLADPEERAARGRAGRREVLAHHTFAHRADVLLDAILRRMEEMGHRTGIVPAPAAGAPRRRAAA